MPIALICVGPPTPDRFKPGLPLDQVLDVQGGDRTSAERLPDVLLKG